MCACVYVRLQPTPYPRSKHSLQLSRLKNFISFHLFSFSPLLSSLLLLLPQHFASIVSFLFSSQKENTPAARPLPFVHTQKDYTKKKNE